jgi:hypothetical protein
MIGRVWITASLQQGYQYIFRHSEHAVYPDRVQTLQIVAHSLAELVQGRKRPVERSAALAIEGVDTGSMFEE